MEFFIRVARKRDAVAIFNLINFYAKRGKLLRRSKADIGKNIRNFFVVLRGSEILGCVSLDIYSRKMAEIRSLAVKQSATRGGIGKALIDACIARAKKKKILDVMVISFEEKFLKKIGFNYTLPGERKALFLNP